MNLNIQRSGLRTAWTVAGTGIKYLISGDIVKSVAHQVLLTASNVSESALMLSLIWITMNFVAHSYMSQLPFGLADTLSNWALLGLTLLPEIVFYAAAFSVYKLWVGFFRGEDKMWCGTWAGLYTLPVAIFGAMTVWTIWIITNGGSVFNPPVLMMHTRAIDGWVYGTLCLIEGLAKSERSSIAITSPVQVPQPIQVQHTVQNSAAVPPPSVQTLPDLEQPAEQKEPITDPEISAAVPQIVPQASGVIEEQPAEQIATSTASERPFLRADYDAVPFPEFGGIVPQSVPQKVGTKRGTKNGTKNAPKPAQIPVKLRVQKLLARTPEIQAKDVAERLNISERYARELMKKVEQNAEQSAEQIEVQNDL